MLRSYGVKGARQVLLTSWNSRQLEARDPKEWAPCVPEGLGVGMKWYTRPRGALLVGGDVLRGYVLPVSS